MRRRLRATRAQVMARRTGAGESMNLSPRARRIGGWVAALLLVTGIAVVVRVLGENGDGASFLPSSSGLPSGTTGVPIAFGTALDPVSGAVAADARSERFSATDLFAYSVSAADLPSGEPVPEAVFVEVRRTVGDAPEIVQEPVDAQTVRDPQVIAFTVPSDVLLAAFGPGEYLMLIYADPSAAPLARGTFQLVGADASPAMSP